ncbi:chitobiase/beta-hexosaminidase C-terminal domain-containing protein [Wenyingzhuangia sp. IMCC45574]
MKKFINYTSRVLLVLHILLVFLLIFESYVSIPFWIQPLGRMHPLILHFPVAFIGLLVLLTFFKKQLDEDSYRKIHFTLLLFTSITTVIATLFGFMLSLEGYQSNLMLLHKWFGVALSFMIYLLVYLFPKKIYKPTLYVSFVLVIVVGHYGAELTHGADFITEPLEIASKGELDKENEPVFTAFVQPIIDGKCISCHNTNKSKGDLDLSSLEGIQKGGKHGAVWVANQPTKSLFIERVLLPLDHKEHMAPEGKPQMTQEEIDLISTWIKSGADVTSTLVELEEKDPLKHIITEKWLTSDKEKTYEFDFADEKDIAELSASPFITITPKSSSSPALDVIVSGSGSYKASVLSDLTKIKNQVVSLNLSSLPVENQDLEPLNQFENLEELILNFTKIDHKGIERLNKLNHLRSLSVSGTQVNDSLLNVLGAFKNLEKLFVWNTKMSPEGLELLIEKFPNYTIEVGVVSTNKKLAVAPPVFVSKNNVISSNQKFILKNLEKEATIRYTIDNSKVTDTSLVYTDGIELDFSNTDAKSTLIKARAFKEGKNPSKEVRFKVFNKGIVPNKVTTEFPNEAADFFGKGSIVTTDDFFPTGGGVQGIGWIAYHSHLPFIATLDFTNKEHAFNEVVLKCGTYFTHRKENVKFAKVWGSNDGQNWKLVDEIKYKKKHWFANKYEIKLDLKNTSYNHYKVKVQNGKGKKFFISQMFFF